MLFSWRRTFWEWMLARAADKILGRGPDDGFGVVVKKHYIGVGVEKIEITRFKNGGM